MAFGVDAAAYFVVGQKQQLVEGAALFKGAGILKVLKFEPDVDASDSRELFCAHHRRMHDAALNAFPGSLDISGGWARVCSCSR